MRAFAITGSQVGESSVFTEAMCGRTGIVSRTDIHGFLAVPLPTFLQCGND
jgi:hypothetical protein